MCFISKLFLVLVATALISPRPAVPAVVTTFGNCMTKDSPEQGVCVPIQECPFLFKILNSNRTAPGQNELLSGSQCGLDNTHSGAGWGSRILVCCKPHQMTSQPIESRSGGEKGNVLPTIGECGTLLADRIVGGTNTSLSEFPWMALLQYKKALTNGYTFNCGGALINSRYVLTAGHCVDSVKLINSGLELHVVRLGEWDTSTAPDCFTEKNGKQTCAPLHMDIEIEKRILHESYLPNSIDQLNDIALLRLKREVSYTDYVKPICLPTGDEVRNNRFESYAMDVAGWGLTEKHIPSPKKLKVTVDVWNLQRCQGKYSAYHYHLNDSQLCAGGKANADTCGGDSGGPLMVSTHVGKQEIFFVAGITSYGPEPCGLPGWPGVYTRTGAFIDWIQQKLEA